MSSSSSSPPAIVSVEMIDLTIASPSAVDNINANTDNAIVDISNANGTTSSSSAMPEPAAPSDARASSTFVSQHFVIKPRDDIDEFDVTPSNGKRGVSMSINIIDDWSSMEPLASPPNDNNLSIHAGDGYLGYLASLSAAWTDCPPVTITFDKLSLSIRDANSIADAQTAIVRSLKESKSGDAVAPSPADENIPNVAKSLFELVKLPLTVGRSILSAVKPPAINQLEVLTLLNECSGVIRPNTMTLVLAPPGGGKSTLLRALSGRASSNTKVTGNVYYNGLTSSECLARGIHVARMCSYVGQNDLSFPVLTLLETLEFASANCAADATLLRSADGKANPSLESLDAQRAELLITMLGLGECKNTIIGSDLLRGVSGGQKKRSQLGESLMSNARLYALDEVSNGLDAAVTHHIFASLKSSCAINNSSVVTALQQVTPETYALFDDVILMREGRILYHGARSEVKEWMAQVMSIPFIPSALEEAGFLIDILSDPKSACEKAALAQRVMVEQMRSVEVAAERAQKEQEQAEKSAPIEKEKIEEQDAPAFTITVTTAAVDSALVGADSQSSSATSSNSLALPAAKRVRTLRPSASSAAAQFVLSASTLDTLMNIASLERACKSSHYAQRNILEVQASLEQSNKNDTMNVGKWSAYTKSQYGRSYPHSLAHHTSLCCIRQVKLMGRNLTMIVPRVISSVIMGLIYGSLFYQLSTSDFSSRLGLITNGVMFMGFANFQEMPVAVEGKQVVVRQIDAGLYPSLSYTIAVNLLTLPLAATEAILFGILLYWIPGFVLSPDRFFFFIFMLMSISSAMSQMFRTITYTVNNADVAQQMNLPFVMLFAIFGGFLIPRTAVPNWLIWAYYLSPFSWATDALAINEFSAGLYSSPDSVDPSRTIGVGYMQAFGFHSEKIWQWASVIYLWLFYLICTIASTIILANCTPVFATGAKRPMLVVEKKREDDVVANVADSIVIPVDAASASNSVSIPIPTVVTKSRLAARSSNRASFQLSALPFTPATLAWRDIKYTVYVGKELTPKVLLKGISGYAEPGKMTALMGSSGAGKTTLLDVIAGRKTVGLIESECNIFINGKPKTQVTNFEHLAAYAEQMDIHNGQATLREALEFSAKLRLPSSVTDDTRHAFINEVIELVGLTSLQHRMIGDVATPSLSTGQLKLLTIAVELVANPSILFLDEPTSGLDSRSAFRVMRAIKRIANTQRTVICTIHQPSQEVFLMFDRLLLLRSGGEVVYFDDIGLAGSKLVKYMSKVSQNIIPYSETMNPGSWMLDALGLDATQLVSEHEAAKKKSDETSATAATAPVPIGAFTIVTDSSSASIGAVDDVDATELASMVFKKKLRKLSRSSASFSAAHISIDLAPISFAAAWSKSAEYTQANTVIDRLALERVSEDDNADANRADAKEEYVSDWVRLYEVVYRAFVTHWRSPQVNVTRFMLLTFVGVLMGLIYANVNASTFSGMSSMIAAIFLGMTIPASITSNASLSPFFRQRSVYYRETSVKMYGYKSNTFAMSIVEMPYMFVSLLCFLIPFYFLIGLNSSPTLFFQFLLSSYLLVLFFHCMEQCYIAALPNLIAAQALNGALNSIFFAFGGLYIKASAIPIGWQWLVILTTIVTYDHARFMNVQLRIDPSLMIFICVCTLSLVILIQYYANPMPKSFIAAILTQVTCSTSTINYASTSTNDGCAPVTVPGIGQVQLYGFISGIVQSDSSQYAHMIGWLILSCGVIRILSIYLFKTVSHIKR